MLQNTFIQRHIYYSFFTIFAKHKTSAINEANGQTSMFGVRSPEDIKNEILDRYGKQSSERQSKQSRPSNQETESAVQGTQPSDEEEVSGNRRVSKEGEVVDAELEEASQRIEDNSEPTSTEEPIAKKLAQEADAFVKAMGGKGVHIVNDVEELPGSEGMAYRAIKSGEKVMGWYNLDNNQVYIYTPNANDKQEVFETLLHEFVAHKGLRDIMGNRRFDNLCKNVWSMMDTNRRLQFGLYVKESLAIGSQRMLARINAMSEQDKKSYLDALSDNDCLAAADEFIAHFAEQGVSEEDRTIWQAIVDAIREWLRKVGFIVGVTEREIAQLLNESHNRLTRDMTIGEMAEAVMRSKLIHERMNSGVDMGFQAEEAEDVATLNKAGEQLNENGVLFNIRSNPQVVAARDRQLKRSVRNGVLSQDEAQDIRDFAESITEIATAVANAKEDGVAQFPSFSMWNGLEVRMNAEGKPVVSVIKSNSEYPMNIDFAKDCVKRTALNNVMDVLADRAPWIFNRLTMDNLVVLNDIIKNHGLQVPCVGCFVESRRYRSADFARTVVDVWNRAVEAIQNGTEKDFLKNNQKISEKRIIEYLQENPQEAIMLSEADIVSPTRYGKLMIEHPEIPTLLQKTQGQNNVQLVVPEAIYFGEVLDRQDWSIDEAYSVGGVRMQSFSDFKPKLFFDYCQVLADLSAKRLPAHSYTKVNSFAELFGKTGMKINLSLYFEGRGVDENGEYTYSVESIDPDFAYELQDREGYTENVGTMAIGLSDEHIWKMLKDPKIRSISPYHKSGINPTVAARLNAEQFTDYTNEQNTCTPAIAREEGESWQDYYHRITARVNGKVPNVGKKVDNVGFNMYDSLLDTDNPAQTAKDYVAYCQANGMVPKYASFVYNEDGSFNEEYYKLLFDFSVTDRNGNYAPQKAVTWREGSMPENTAELLKTYLSEEEKATQAVRAEIEPIVDEVMDALGEGTRFRFSKSAQEFDAIQKEAVEKNGIVMPGLNEAVVAMVSVPRHEFKGNLKEAREEAKLWAIEEYQGKEFILPEDGGSYTIGKKAINKYIDKTSIEKSDNAMIHLSALTVLPNIISSSTTGEIHADYKKGEDGERRVDNGIGDKGLLVHRMYGAIKVDDKVYRVKTTMHEYRDPMANNTPHSYEVTEIELLESSSTPSLKDDSKPLNVSNNSISGAKLLKGVEKSYDKGKKLLDESKKTSYGSQKSENDIRFRFTEEEQGIIDKSKADGTWMKAPNGKPTNLNEKQWAQVRTKAFKKWFGDWMKAARIDKLRESKPVEMNGEEHIGKYELNRESAQSYILNNLRGSYVIADTNEQVELVKKGAKKVTSHSMGNDVHIKSIALIPKIIQSSIFVEEMPSEKDDSQYDSYRYYVCGLDYNGESYTVKVTIGVKGGDYYYDHSLTEVEKGKLLDMIESNQAVSRKGFTPTGDAPIPSYALSRVKDTKLLSILQTNSSKIVDENGEPMPLKHRTFDEFNVFDKEKIGSNTDSGAFGTGFYFAKRDYILYGNKTMEVFVNMKKPLRLDNSNAYEVKSKFFKDGVSNQDAAQAMTEWSVSQGYDGVIWDAAPYDYEAVAYEPNQIKSAETVTYDDNGNVIPLSERFNDDKSDIRFRISNDIDKQYPNWLEGTTTERGKHSARVEGTRKTYNKVGTWIEENLGKNVSILDASSGMGYGTQDLRERGFNIEDVEPYQSESRKKTNPATYSSYGDIDKQYDFIISNAVLNVIPDDWRRNVLHDMASRLKNGGKMFINTRKAGEEKSIKDKIELDSPQEILVKRNGKIASYQRFFTPSELKEYVQSELGDGYLVEIATNKNSGTSGLAAVVVTKSDEGTRFRLSNENQRIFVSNAERAVESIKQDKATPQQWKAMIEKQGGLKAGEDKWLGLSDWLEEKANATIEMTNDETIAEYAKRVARAKTLTKQEILDFIDENKIQIEEVKYTQFGYGLIDEATRKLETELKEIGWDAMVEKYPGFDELFEVHNGELLWSEERASVGDYEDFIIDEKIVDLDSQSNAINETREKYTTDGLERKREIALVVPTIESWNETDEIHFGDAGGGRAVAWVRFGETTDSDGNRVLVIDEIQSKRHQEGREKGYYVAASSKELLQRKDKAEKDYIDFLESMRDKYGDLRKPELYTHFSDEEVAEADRLNEAANQARSDWFASEKDAVPSAPFEKNWHELAMKRMLRYAAENGYDYVAWTKGEQQAERYDIGKVVNRIESNDTVDYDSTLGVDLVKQVVLFTRDGNAITLRLTPEGIVRASSQYNGHHISDIVGKELGNRIMTETDLILKEQDLRIGGEGMKGFYDKMLPSFVSKYTKKWGAKVEDIELPKLEESAQTMHAVNVTPEMKKSVMEGQVMFKLSSSNKSITRYDKENGTDVKGFFDFLRGGKVFEKGKPNAFHIANAGALLEQYGIKGKFMVGQFTFSRTHTDNEDHNLGVKEWIDVINNLNNPLAITSYKGLPNQYRIYTYARINGKNICVGVNVSLQDDNIELSNIISAYGRDISNLLSNESVNLLYPDIEELKRRISQVSTAHNSLLNATSSASEGKDTKKIENPKLSEENGIRFRTTYHGSASDFAKFDHSFMGTGEGLQSFGWGTYVTEVEDIAKRYANVALKSERKFKYTGDKDVKKSIVEDAEGLIDNAGGFDEALQMYEGHRLPSHYPLAIAFDFIRSTSKSDWEGQRHMYEVEIPDANEAYYIDYKDRMSNQGEIFTMVDNALASDGWQRKEVDDKVVFTDGVNRIVLNPKQTGGDFYNELAFGLGSPQAASEYLNDVVGISGIQYDANYHNGGNEDGAKNYVIFNADDAQVVSNTRFSMRGNAWSDVPAYNPGETIVA